jgi:site-specific DNA-methyltransferase (adenine-specific)
MTKELLGGLELNRIYQRDCLSDGGMALIPDKSIDLILCDLPYGTTQCKWDAILPFDELWSQYERVIKDDGVIVLTAAQPFTTNLISSNLNLFKYCWVWDKKKATGALNAKYRPMVSHEDICIFYKKQGKYFPQMEDFTEDEIKRMRKHDVVVENPQTYNPGTAISKGWYEGKKKNPKSVIRINALAPMSREKKEGKHPTQKPVELFEYLIKTYSNEGEIVLDNCMGSGTTAVGALNTNRRFIGFETEPAYIEIANKRIEGLI